MGILNADGTLETENIPQNTRMLIFVCERRSELILISLKITAPAQRSKAYSKKYSHALL